jgi:hypothetical protein
VGKGRLEAFSDGVIAIIITIMVLELKVPEGGDWAALRPLTPVFLSYVLGFVLLGIYWNNHHHLLHACRRQRSGPVGEHASVVLAVAGAGRDRLDGRATSLRRPSPYAASCNCLLRDYILTLTLIAAHGHDSPLAAAVGRDRAKCRCDLGWNSRLVPEAARGVCSLRAGGRHLVRSRSSH